MKNDWMISFSDIWHTFKRAKIKIALLSLLVGLICFFYQMQKPLVYTSEAIFHCPTTVSKNELANTFQALFGSSNSINEDARSLINSTAVLDLVVKNLHLQTLPSLTVKQKRKNTVWNRIKKNVATQAAYLRFSYVRPDSPILDSTIAIPNKPLFPEEKKCPIAIEALKYDRNTFLNLKIAFQSEKHFLVLNARDRCIGDGYLDRPFEWRDLSFVVTKTDKSFIRGTNHPFSLIPTEFARESLRKNLKVKFEKGNPSLVKLSYTHTDKELSVAIVNEVMHAYHEYLLIRAEKAAEHQFAYLEKKKNESAQAFEQTAVDYKNYLQEHIEKQNLFSTEEDLSFLSEKQRACYTSIAQILKEMHQIDESHQLKVRKETNEELIQKVHAWKEASLGLWQEAKSLNLETLKTQLQQYQKELDQIELEKRNCTACLEKLKDPTFDVVALTNTLSMPQLEPHFEKIETLNFKLHDKMNWTQKEQSCFREELALEKGFLTSHIANLIEGSTIRKGVLEDKIDSMKKNGSTFASLFL